MCCVVGLVCEVVRVRCSDGVFLVSGPSLTYGAPPQEAIDRVRQLQEMSRLTGVVDDRGKFIFISQEELESVAAFVKLKGRVSIQDLAAASSSLVQLQQPQSTVVQ